MQFNYTFGNPPFQDSKNRSKTQHKLWIEFTEKFFNEGLVDGGEMFWITPNSWGSPSNKVFKIFKQHDVKYLNLDIDHHFPNIGSTFGYFHIKNSPFDNKTTGVWKSGEQFSLKIDDEVKYFPSDFCNESISIHKKVMFSNRARLDVKHDYVTCHNVIRHAKTLLKKKINNISDKIQAAEESETRSKFEERLKKYEQDLKDCVITISETKTNLHIHPVFHTNNKTWYSSIRQDFADNKKVMWSRSGYTKPFYDDGKLGCTDMGYYILVDIEGEGLRLEKFLTSPLMTYIFRTAKWSGFGNEIVFSSIPKIDLSKDMDNDDYYKLFSLTKKEVDYVKKSGSKKRAKNKPGKDAEVKKESRKKNLGEVYTPCELVLEMLERLDSKKWENANNTFIDPAGGSGNFLVEIVRKKIQTGSTPLQAVETTYGIDIMPDNVAETRERILDIAIENSSCDNRSEILEAVNKNIRLGNSLKHDLADIFSPNPSSELKKFREEQFKSELLEEDNESR